MQQRQDNPLNRSRVPQKRGQVQPGPAASASRGDVQGLFSGLGNYADDAGAAAGGVAVGSLYRNGSVLMIRVA